MTRVRHNQNWLLEAVQSDPTKTILRDLAAGELSPVAAGPELERRYRAITQHGTDIEACMSAACRTYEDTVGAVLVITDRDGSRVFGQATDPGLDKNDQRMSATYNLLIRSVPGAHVEEMAKSAHAVGKTITSVEYPVYVMPRHDYAGEDGPAVSRFGDYLISYDAPVATD